MIGRGGDALVDRAIRRASFRSVSRRIFQTTPARLLRGEENWQLGLMKQNERYR
jgi:hypothetical protein